MLINVRNVKVFFHAKEESELQKVEAAAQKTINTLQKEKDFKHKKKLERFKKF